MKMRTCLAMSMLFLIATTVTGEIKIPGSIDFPDGWRLNGSYPRDIERKFLVIADKTTAYKGEKYAFVRGHLISKEILVNSGDTIEISFFVKDPALKDIGCYLYAYSSGRFLSTYTVFTSKSTSEWSQVSGKIQIPDTSPNRIDVVTVVMASNTGAYFDYPAILHIPAGRNAESVRYEAVADIKVKEGDYKSAMDLMQQALAYETSEVEKRKIISKIEEISEKKKHFKSCQKIAEVLSEAGTYIKKGNYKKAESLYQQLAGDKETPEVYFSGLCGLGGIKELRGDVKGALKIYESLAGEPKISTDGKIYVLFQAAQLYELEKKYPIARERYKQIINTEGAADVQKIRAEIKTADILIKEKRYSDARSLLVSIEKTSMGLNPPHEHFRNEAVDRLNMLDKIADGHNVSAISQQDFIGWISCPKEFLYVSTEGSDRNAGTKARPFRTFEKARDVIRSKKKENVFPKGGITVFIRGGTYYMDSPFTLTAEDSGTPDGPIVYRAYPGEKVRLIGGVFLSRFCPVTDTEVLNRIPQEAHTKVLQVDLKAAGITNYGKLYPRGYGSTYQCDASPLWGQPYPSAAELFYKDKRMELARWPNEGWARTGDTALPGLKLETYSYGVYNKAGKFRYIGNRPERWKGEDEIWMKGYWSQTYEQHHRLVKDIDTGTKIITLDAKPRPEVCRGFPYFAYNILGELDRPGEWYLDRKTGILYFWPPGDFKNNDIWLSTLAGSVVTTQGASYTVFHDLLIEGSWEYGIHMTAGNYNLISKSTVRNTGKAAILVEGGRYDSIVGCDIYGTGDGGIILEVGEENRKMSRGRLAYFSKDLEPVGHLVENCHIHHINQVGGGYGAGVYLGGCGQRMRNNLIHDNSYQAVHFRGNDHLIEYNEVYDVSHEPRDHGVFYINESSRSIAGYRGNVIRFNFVHHICSHQSPHETQGLSGLYLDGVIPAGVTAYGNMFYKFDGLSIYSGGGRDCRFENNLFIDCKTAISQGDRQGYLLNEDLKKRWIENVSEVLEYPRWRERFPQLIGTLEEEPLGLPINNVYQTNIATGIKDDFLSIPTGIEKYQVISCNWTDKNGNPFFMDRDNRDFRLAYGSPVFYYIGFEPIPVNRIGVYKDPLRCSWPIDKSPAGKYWDEKKFSTGQAAQSQRGRIPQNTQVNREYFAPAKVFTAQKITEVVFPGSLFNKISIEDVADLMPLFPLEKNAEQEMKPVGFASVYFDDRYLYIALRGYNIPDIKAGEGLSEVSIEGLWQDWWPDDLLIGPIYIFWGQLDGTVRVLNLYGLPDGVVKHLEQEVCYASDFSKDTGIWKGVWRFPLGLITNSVEHKSTFRLNIGGHFNNKWYGWVNKGVPLHYLEYAGEISFK